MSSAVDAPAPPVPPAEEARLLEQVESAAAAAGRPDLVARLGPVKERLADPRSRVVLVGELGQGKSQLVNSLLGVPVCPVGDDATTAVPTVVSHAVEPSAELLTRSPGESRPTAELISLDDLAGRLAAGTGSADELLRAEVGLPNPLLREGLVIVDTPGVGVAGSTQVTTTLGLLPAADAILFLSDASQEYTEPELAFLRQALALCPVAACVLTKIDLYPQWRDIGAADRGHLDRAGVGAPLVAVSSLLRSHALRTGDAGLNAEAGFPDLLTFVRHQVVARRDVLTRAAVGREVAAVAEHLAVSLRAEAAALADPAVGERVMAELAAAKTAAEGLHQHSSRWQQTLNDGSADLLNDLDHDLRDRVRRVTRSAEDAIDAVDPGLTWGEFTEWLEAEVVRAVCDNFVWAHERAVWLAEKVAEHFTAVQEVALPELDLSGTDGVLEPVSGLSPLDSGRLNPSQKLIVGMRGSYGGVLMFGMVTSLMGLALVNPISLGAGLLLGTKAYKDDKEQRLSRRRNEGKAAVRRFADDVVFQVNKQSKDRLREVQRTLRDHFAVVAEQTVRTLNESLAAGRAAASTAESERDGRRQEIERQLGVLADLQARGAALVGT